jgi:cytochrome c5
MHRHNRLFVLMVALALLVMALPAGAQGEMGAPSVEVVDQVVLDGTVTIASAYSEGPGWLVIHADGGGAPGPVIGYRALNAGATQNLQVSIDAAQATPTLYAMLHTDTGEVGVYEFGTVDGADIPVRVNDQVVTPAFNIDLISASDQFVTNGQVTIDAVVAQQPGWLVIHADGDGSPGPVLGQTQVPAGASANVAVALTGDATAVLWPMLHVDTGVEGTYEFGAVEGADVPVRVNDRVAVTPLWTVPHMRVDDQIVLGGDGMEAMAEPSLVARSVLSEGPGWLVVHADGGGSPGPVLGQAALASGLNTDVAVTLDPAGITPVLWPMLHVDTGVEGTYEFGAVEGADVPVRVNDDVVTFPIHAAPSLTLSDQTLDAGMLLIDAALIDAPGWIAVHSSQDGAPGPVIATYPLPAGLSRAIHIPLDAAQAGQQVFPMLHYDTGEAGVYEFNTVEGADGPVRVGDAVIVGPINLGAAGEAMGEGAEEAHDMGAALDGNALIDERCTVCHSRERIDQAQKSPEEWAATVDRMIGYGAQLTPEERQAVLDYLSAAGAESAAPVALDGNALIDERCTVCHSRERIDQAQKSPEEWAATVDRMIGYGAQLTPEERQAVIDYLTSR